MSDYTQSTFFAPKDLLATGNPNKIIYGSDVDAELSAISTAIATKADVNGDAIGAGTPCTELSVDNLKLDGNKITSTNTDGDIELEPDGTGIVTISSNVGIGGTSTTSIPTLDEGVYLQSQTNDDIIGYNLYVNEGTNNRRASFFLDDSAGVYGFDSTASTGLPDFVIRFSGSEAMRIDDSGKVGIGTSSPENLLHVKGASAGALEMARFRLEGATNNPMLKIEADEANQTAGLDVSGSTATELTFSVAGTERMRITSGGDISFYEDTGTAAKFFWDASAESLGLGRTPTSDKLEIDGSGIKLVNNPTGFGLKMFNSSNHHARVVQTGSDLVFGVSSDTNGTERARIDSSGRLLVGKTTAISSISSIEADGSIAASNFFSGADSASLANNTATTVLDLAQTKFRNTVLRVKSYDTATHTMGVADVFVNWNGGTYVVALDQIYSGQNTSEFTLSGTNLQFRHTFGSTRNITTVWQVV